MSTRRTFARSAAVVGAATALTVAGAGAAMATTHDSNVDGNDVSVTFTLDEGLLDIGDTCGAFLAPTSAAPALANQLANGDIRDILESLVNDDNVIVLESERTGLPVVALGQISGVGGVTSGTATAEDVPSNVYALVSHCLTDTGDPTIEPMLVGDPIEAITGSIEMGSANGGLDTASAMLGDGGLDTASALLGGEGELDGDMLGLLSGSGAGDTED